jgi:hypothetical protein
MKNTFEEPYTVLAWYQKEDGFWDKISVTQNVSVVNGVNEKNNHEKAKELFLENNKHLNNLEVKSVIYQ